MSSNPPIPITLITGFLGSGKTTLILHLLPQLPPPPTTRLCLLKNEFGSTAIDSQLLTAQNTDTSTPSIAGIHELLNGCICCNLVGQLSTALDHLRTTYNPTRIVIETSGSAFPATLAMEINRLARETSFYALDSVLTLIDVENWPGYSDTSYTAKLQSKFTDLIILSKWESVSEQRLDTVIDRIRDLNDQVPIIKSERGFVSKDVIFGIIEERKSNNSYISRSSAPSSSDVLHSHTPHDHDHNHSSEVDVLSIYLPSNNASSHDKRPLLSYPHLHTLLTTAPKDEIYRIKAIFKSATLPTLPPNQNTLTPSPINTYILNWAFGRWTITPMGGKRGEAMSSGRKEGETPDFVNGSGTEEESERWVVKMTVVLARGEAVRWKGKVEKGRFVRYEGEEGLDKESNVQIEILA